MLNVRGFYFILFLLGFISVIFLFHKDIIYNIRLLLNFKFIIIIIIIIIIYISIIICIIILIFLLIYIYVTVNLYNQVICILPDVFS